MFVKQLAVYCSSNLVVIVALLTYRATRARNTTPFILSISILDLIYSAFILPILALRFGFRSAGLVFYLSVHFTFQRLSFV